MKPLSFNRLRDSFVLPPIIMAETYLHERDSLRFLGLTISADTKRKVYIETVARSAASNLCLLSRAWHFFRQNLSYTFIDYVKIVWK